MDSNSFNLTQENMTSDTSLTSSEDGFVYLNGTKTKGTMTGKMDLIPKMEKNKDMHSVKAKTIKERLLDFIQRFGKLFKKSPKNDIEARKSRSSWRCDCFSSINKDCLTSIYKGFKIFLSVIILVLIFMLILAVFWTVFKTVVFESPFLGKLWILFAMVSIIALVCAICIYFFILCKILIECQFNLISKDLLSSISNIVLVSFIVSFSILSFVFFLVLFYPIFETIIFDDTFTQNRIICAILALIAFFSLLFSFCSALYHTLMDCPFINK